MNCGSSWDRQGDTVRVAVDHLPWRGEAARVHEASSSN